MLMYIVLIESFYFYINSIVSYTTGLSSFLYYGHSGCFCIFAITNNALVRMIPDIHVQKFI